MTLSDFFSQHVKCALAFSGGVDSSYLLYAASVCKADVKPYYVKSAFQPLFEYEDARKLCSQLGFEMRTIDLDVLCDRSITSNPSNRCYFCKKRIFSSIVRAAADDGYRVLLDGTNASDQVADRPGMAVLKELSVLSPLRLCGLTKDDVRELSRKAGLFTWDKPSYSCLATRIMNNEEITLEKLEITEKAEDFMFSLGFSDFRVRMVGRDALIQVTGSQMHKLEKSRDLIVEKLSPYYENIVFDSRARQASVCLTEKT